METLDRQPLRASLLLLGAAAFYMILLLQVTGAQGGWAPPDFMERWLQDPLTRRLVWDQLTHTLVVVLLSLPFAWGLTRLYTRRLLPAALMLVTPVTAWMVLDYLSLGDELPSVPIVTAIYFADVAKVALILPLLVLLLRKKS